ncbi:lipopolysaccharide biosynthesis protein [Thalassolituus sp. LLYu03]|uniref:lipopolysaccharide biosynthesis protein n=1 Tax=Thalassolituus sp. LLYu03 TaxID=3421656 RepID=UPI003D2E94A9
MGFIDIIKAMSWYSAAKLAILFASIASVAIFTRLLTPDEFGQVAIYVSWVAILTPVLGMGLSLSIPRSQVEFPHSLSSYGLTLLTFSGTFFLVVLLAIFVLNIDVSEIVGIRPDLVLLLSLHIVSSMIGSIYVATMQYNMSYKRVSVIALLKTVTGLMLAYYFVVWLMDDPILGRLWGMIVAELMVALYAVIDLSRESRAVIEWRYLAFGLTYSAPFILGSVSATINNQFDRVMLANMVSNSEAAIYSLGTTLGILSFTLWVALRQAIIPWLYRAYSAERFSDIRHLYAFLGWSALFGTIGGMLIAKEAIHVLSEKEYWEASTVVIFILCCSYIQILTLNETETQMYRKKTLANSVIIIVGAIANISFNYIYIPEYGYNAALCSTLISCLLMHMLFYYYNLHCTGDVLTTPHGYSIKIIIAITSAFAVNLLSDHTAVRYGMLLLLVITACVYIWRNIGGVRRILQ